MFDRVEQFPGAISLHGWCMLLTWRGRLSAKDCCTFLQPLVIARQVAMVLSRGKEHAWLTLLEISGMCVRFPGKCVCECHPSLACAHVIVLIIMLHINIVHRFFTTHSSFIFSARASRDRNCVTSALQSTRTEFRTCKRGEGVGWGQHCNGLMVAMVLLHQGVCYIASICFETLWRQGLGTRENM